MKPVSSMNSSRMVCWLRSRNLCPLIYQTVKLECGYRVDMLVERKLIVEVKAVEALAEIHFAQVLTYLRLSDLRLALMLNFNVVHMKDGIRRVVNKL